MTSGSFPAKEHSIFLTVSYGRTHASFMDRSLIGMAWTVLAGVLTVLLIVAVFYSCRSGETAHEAEYGAAAPASVVQSDQEWG